MRSDANDDVDDTTAAGTLTRAHQPKTASLPEIQQYAQSCSRTPPTSALPAPQTNQEAPALQIGPSTAILGSTTSQHLSRQTWVFHFQNAEGALLAKLSFWVQRVAQSLIHWEPSSGSSQQGGSNHHANTCTATRLATCGTVLVGFQCGRMSTRRPLPSMQLCGCSQLQPAGFSCSCN